eukprot:1136394-Pelagomonas_calceolata.AAC.3
MEPARLDSNLLKHLMEIPDFPAAAEEGGSQEGLCLEQQQQSDGVLAPSFPPPTWPLLQPVPAQNLASYFAPFSQPFFPPLPYVGPPASTPNLKSSSTTLHSRVPAAAATSAVKPPSPSNRKYYKYHMQRLQTTSNHVLFYVRDLRGMEVWSFY